MKKENISMLVYFIVGIVSGYISFLLNNNYYSLILMIVILFASSMVMGKIMKVKEKMKWWMKNGGFIYIFIWFIFWVIFLNL